MFAPHNYIPFFDLNLKVRKIKTNIWFESLAEAHLYNYDLLIDFDSKDKKDFELMVLEIEKLIGLLLLFKVCFYIIPSGNNFQVVIKNNNLYTQAEIILLLGAIKENLNLKHSDLIGIGSTFKLMKLPYGLVKNIVSIPLHNIMNLKEFDLIDTKDFYNDLFNYNNLKKLFIYGHKENFTLWYNETTPKQEIINLKSFVNYLKLE